MSIEELTELVRQVSMGRRDAADKLAEILFNLQPVQKVEYPADIPPKRTRKVVAE